MTATTISSNERTANPSVSDRGPLLRWLVFTGATVFAAILLWRYGFLAMVVSDRTYSHRSFAHLRRGVAPLPLANARRSRAKASANSGRRRSSRPGRRRRRCDDGPSGARASASRPRRRRTFATLPSRRARKGARRLDQTLLLRGLADRLRGSNGFGAFASDTLMKLGLLGTIIGFIIMLAPIAGPRRERQGR